MLEKKKIAIIGTVGVPANYGGFETLAEHLIEDLGQHHELTVYCSGKKYPKEQRQAHYKAAIFFFFNLFCFIPLVNPNLCPNDIDLNRYVLYI